MALIDTSHSELDNTVRIFDAFYQTELVISADQYDIVNSYFTEVTGSKNTGSNFTAFLFRIATITGENVLTLLDQMQGTGKLEMNALMAYYLNGLKSKTTLYGVGAMPQPNEPIQRNVVI